MSNPVFNKLEREWAGTTPAGYPTMPGYQVGAPGAQTQYAPPSPHRGTQQGGPISQSAPSGWDQQAMEAAWQAPAADAVDRGRMTFDDVLVKTGLSFALLLAVGTVSWWAATMNSSILFGLVAVGFIGGFVLALVNSFSRTIRPALVLAYAAFEGMALGAFSMLMEHLYPGIVIQAVLATLAVFGVTLVLFTMGIVRNSPKLAKIALIGLVGLLVYRLVNMLLVAFGVIGTSFSNTTISILGLQVEVGVLVGLIAVGIGTLCLIQDFDQAKVGIQMGAPSRYAWACAFGLMVTIVWMYLEILQLLARLRD
ncbi:Bax inhibitor-1/YccA family protein [Schaalia sp. 19OD2882]|uniref:Bax inhibitor-1/YccA family protein n=1 Tax=Schaalia sp. 19OD2882 TaxID=2794089 RepID=UPI001C1F034E|nr:Bax inhibitor-1/YccA family protein [Schaalia sp. 19OD2882]QWW20197.1 Bax inhibitor-1/YccA family protein [Schaalia sp. 19OD2882]